MFFRKKSLKLSQIPRWWGLLLAICGLALMFFGIYRGEMTVVLTKAINICLECIGIG